MRRDIRRFFSNSRCSAESEYSGYRQGMGVVTLFSARHHSSLRHRFLPKACPHCSETAASSPFNQLDFEVVEWFRPQCIRVMLSTCVIMMGHDASGLHAISFGGSKFFKKNAWLSPTRISHYFFQLKATSRRIHLCSRFTGRRSSYFLIASTVLPNSRIYWHVFPVEIGIPHEKIQETDYLGVRPPPRVN